MGKFYFKKDGQLYSIDLKTNFGDAFDQTDTDCDYVGNAYGSGTSIDSHYRFGNSGGVIYAAQPAFELGVLINGAGSGHIELKYTQPGESEVTVNLYDTDARTLEVGTTYSWTAVPDGNSYCTTTEQGSGTIADRDVILTASFALCKSLTVTMSGYNTYVEGTIYRNGHATVVDDFTIIERNTPYINSSLRSNDNYFIQAKPNNGYYLEATTPQDEHPNQVEGYINTEDVDISFIHNAILYRTITLNFGTNVHYISLTIDGTSKTYYNPDPNSTYTTTISDIKQGLSYSWTAHAVTNYEINNDESGSGNTTSGDVTISPTAYRPTYSFSITAGSHVNITGMVGDDSVDLVSGGTYTGTIEKGKEYSLTVSAWGTGYYMPDDATTSYSGNVSSDISLGTSDSALAYHYFSLHLNPGIASIDLTVNGVTTNYTTSQTTDGYKQGLSYSWTTNVATGWDISSGGTGSGTTNGETTNIGPAATRQKRRITADIIGTGSSYGYIWLNYTEPDSSSALSIRLDDGDYIDLDYNTIYTWTVYSTDTDEAYVASGGSSVETALKSNETLTGQCQLNPVVTASIKGSGSGKLYVTYKNDTRSANLYNGDSVRIPYNTTYSWRAIPDSGSYAAGIDSGSGTITADTTVTVTFQPNPVITASISGDGSGYIWFSYTEPGTSEQSIRLDNGDSITLAYNTTYSWRAIPDSGSYVSGTETGSGTAQSSWSASTTFTKCRTFYIKVGSNAQISGSVGGHTVSATSGQEVSYSDLKTTDSYSITVGAWGTDYYMPSGATLSYTGTCSSNVNLGTTSSASAYHKFNITISGGVYSVILTINGSSTTYTSSNSIKAIQGLAYSWSSTSKNGFDITSGGSGSGTTNGGTTNISPTASRRAISVEFPCTVSSGVTIYFNYTDPDSGQTVSSSKSISSTTTTFTVPYGTSYISWTTQETTSNIKVVSGGSGSYSNEITAKYTASTIRCGIKRDLSLTLSATGASSSYAYASVNISGTIYSMYTTTTWGTVACGASDTIKSVVLTKRQGGSSSETITITSKNVNNYSASVSHTFSPGTTAGSTYTFNSSELNQLMYIVE